MMHQGVMWTFLGNAGVQHIPKDVAAGHTLSTMIEAWRLPTTCCCCCAAAVLSVPQLLLAGWCGKRQ